MREGRIRTVAGILFSALGTLAALSAGGGTATADPVVHLELVEAVPNDAGWNFSIASGHIEKTLDDGTVVQASWTELPKTLDASGFKITMTVSASRPVTPARSRDVVQVAASIGSYNIVVTPAAGPGDLNVYEGDQLSQTQDYLIASDPRLMIPGQILEIGVSLRANGAHAGMTYRYRIVDGPAGNSGGQIAAELVGCPATITISELPSLTCHLKISGFRHNTADPVEVVLPAALGLQGNHSNGLQLPQSAGVLDVSRMDDPHMWSLTLFACPGQPGAGVNCEGTAAAPGSLSVPIVVRQKDAGETRVMLNITAVAGPNSVVEGNAGSGETVTTTPIPAGPGQIGAAMDCPGSIVISALPSLNCHIIITGWRKDTAAPVRVSLPSSITSPGNHNNGIQIYGQGEQDLSQWANEDSYRWGIFVFACPGQSSSGVNCEGRVTTPGPKVVLIEVEQEGLESAMLAFQIDARPAE